jgi:hypothetical protein
MHAVTNVFSNLGVSAVEIPMRDFAIHLTHRPGELARVANALARKGINLKSVAAVVIGNQGMLRLIADDVEAARAALNENNISFEENEVVTVLLENHAGELENVADKLAKANVNVHAIYVVGLDGNLVDLALAVDDPKKAKKTAGINDLVAAAVAKNGSPREPRFKARLTDSHVSPGAAGMGPEFRCGH